LAESAGSVTTSGNLFFKIRNLMRHLMRNRIDEDGPETLLYK